MKTLRAKILPLYILAFALCLGFTACSDDDDNNNGSGTGGTELLGYWYAPNGGGGGIEFILLYNFINYNTVTEYSTVSNSTEGWIGDYAAIPGHSGWYHAPGTERNYTYVVADNKVIISDGTVLTIADGRLLEDGSSTVYYKW